MRRRNREVNIFNMSLLDILCGALGAFCFMTLALFPSFITVQAGGGNDKERLQRAEERANEAERKANEAEKTADQAKKDQSLVYFNIRWDTGDDVDLWVKGPSGTMYSVAKHASDKKTGIIADKERGPGGEGVWFPDVQHPNSAWEIFAERHSPGEGVSPVVVRGYATARSQTGDTGSMWLIEFGTVTLARQGERKSFGRLVFDQTGRDVHVEEASQQP